MTAAASASKMTVPQLREELKSKGLDATGLKAELVARLEASRSGGDDAGAPRAISSLPPPIDPSRAPFPSSSPHSAFRSTRAGRFRRRRAYPRRRAPASRVARVDRAIARSVDRDRRGATRGVASSPPRDR